MDNDLWRQRCLLWTCVHEAGHAVVGHQEGYDVTRVTILGPGHGKTAGVNENNVYVAVAGYAAVEAVLGVDAREANVAADMHLEPDSDIMIAISAAADAGWLDETAIWRYIEVADAQVSERLKDNTLAAVAEIGLYLSQMSGLKMLSGEALWREIGQANDAESGALDTLRACWAVLN